mmetsp:Transcript_4551/g.8776  ORF Transcript_4551/g.8776 Transcript_4551/m.8776 type:complete len:557 (+) Transcript_4551:115-1785(+)
MVLTKRLSFLLLSLIAIFSLLQCPYSKVEESFNLQATHDLYFYGIWPAVRAHWFGLSNIDSSVLYDHLKYPGVVPRTFVGPLIISTVLKVLSAALRPLINLDNHPLALESLARGVLLIFNLHALYRLANAAEEKIVKLKGCQYLMGIYMFLITASQFHIPYYASRMLPNSFALVLVIHAYADWIMSNINRSIVWMTVATFIFRCDVLILLFTFGMTLLIRREIGIVQAIKTGVVTVIVSLLMTVPFDSIMWHRLLWPEGEVFLFNVVHNKSSEYGTSPWHWYFSTAMPKGLLLSMFFIPLSFVRISLHNDKIMSFQPSQQFDLEALPYFVPVAAFIALYSFLPHKEIRFIFIAFPMLNVLAAKGMVNLHHALHVAWEDNSLRKKDKQPMTKLKKFVVSIMYLGGLCAMILSFAVSMVFVQVSKLNYPGGHALRLLANHPFSDSLELDTKMQKQINIFIDVASAMTGVSLFGQRYLVVKGISDHAAQCIISKAGYEIDNTYGEELDNVQFDFILSENSHMEGFEVIHTAKGHPWIDWRNLAIHSKNAIFVQRRKQNA